MGQLREVINEYPLALVQNEFRTSNDTPQLKILKLRKYELRKRLKITQCGDASSPDIKNASLFYKKKEITALTYFQIFPFAFKLKSQKHRFFLHRLRFKALPPLPPGGGGEDLGDTHPPRVRVPPPGGLGISKKSGSKFKTLGIFNQKYPHSPSA